MQNKPLVWFLLVGAALVVGGGMAFAGDNWMGAWKLNPVKSQIGPNDVRAQTLTYESTPAGIKVSSVGIDAQGKPMKSEFTTKFEGKDVPWTGNPMADTASAKKIDDNSYESAWKKGGKVTVRASVYISPDGKTMTVTHTGADVQGKEVRSVAVYDRQ